jgi:hypothetical protein
MLVACQLAGLSALGAHYAGVKWRATRDKRLRPSFRGSAARDREGGLKGRGGHAAGLGGSRAGCAARPLRWCKKEGNGRLRRVGMGFLRSERALMPRGQCTIPHSSILQWRNAEIREARDPRLLFHAKNLIIRAIHGKTRSTIGVRSPRSAKAHQALGEGSAVRVFCGQGPI